MDVLVQEGRNSSALAMDLCISCTNPSVFQYKFVVSDVSGACILPLLVVTHAGTMMVVFGSVCRMIIFAHIHSTFLLNCTWMDASNLESTLIQSVARFCSMPYGPMLYNMSSIRGSVLIKLIHTFIMEIHKMFAMGRGVYACQMFCTVPIWM